MTRHDTSMLLRSGQTCGPLPEMANRYIESRLCREIACPGRGESRGFERCRTTGRMQTCSGRKMCRTTNVS